MFLKKDGKKNEEKNHNLRMEVAYCFLIGGSCLLSWKNAAEELMAPTDQGQKSDLGDFLFFVEGVLVLILEKIM